MTVTTFDGFVNDQGGQVVNVTNPAYGARGDTRRSPAGGSIALGTQIFRQSVFAFTADDAGKVMTIQGAGLGGAVLTTTIQSVIDAGTARLLSPAPRAVTDAGFTYGTDDTKAMLTAMRAANGGQTLYVPAGIYTILGSSNDGDTNGGNQLHLATPGGLQGDGGRFDPLDPASEGNTTFLCADEGAGVITIARTRYQGFLVDGNNIATRPLMSNVYTANAPTAGGASYSTFDDVWVARSAGTGWSLFGVQNNAHYDCGSVDNALDGIHLDGGTGGHAFFNFYERGSLRYGVHCDNQYAGAGFLIVSGDNDFFGCTFDSHAGRRGVSKAFLRAAYLWSFHDTTFVGDNLSGPTVDMDQTQLNGHGNKFENCAFWATPKGTEPGNACIRIRGEAIDDRKFFFVKTDGCAFMSGDNSVYVVDNNGGWQYTASGWTADLTTHGPAASPALPDADVMLMGRTGGWKEATIDAEWDGAVRYRILGEGWIQLAGSVVSRAGKPGPLFSLPLGFRTRTGQPLDLIAATVDATESEFGVGAVTIRSGADTTRPGEVSFAPIAGSGTFGAGSRVWLDGLRFSVRGESRDNW